MPILEKGKAQTFASPTQLPSDPEERAQWLRTNQEWWESHPMSYDWTEELGYAPFTLPYYQEIDRRFFGAAAQTLPYKKVPFDSIIHFDELGNKRVLEIGVGNGSHAQLLALHSKAFTGIDLTERAVESTTKRMALLGIKNASILQMNAEEMTFPDRAFDEVWSWGVIHHSANTRLILKEVNRVLTPNGRFTAMIYYRGFWMYYVRGVIMGLLHGGLGKGLHHVNQKSTDGAIARFYTIREWTKELEQAGFRVRKMQTFSSKADILLLPPGKFKSFLVRLMPNWLGRFLVRRLRMGAMLISEAYATE